MPSACEMGRDRVRAPAARRSWPKRPRGPIRQQHIVEHGQIADQRQFLEGGLDAMRMGDRAATVRRTGSPNMRKPPRSGSDQAGKQLDDGRFAGAVLAEQRMHLAARDGEGGVVERDGGAVDLAHVLDTRRADEPAMASASRTAEGGRGASPALRTRSRFSGSAADRAACKPISGVSGE